MSAHLLGGVVLLVGHLLHPVDDFSVELLLDGDVGHCRRRRCAMPVLLVWRAPHDVTGPYDANSAARALDVAAAGSTNERLAEGMRVPVASRRRLEGHIGAARARRRRRLEELVDAHRAGEILCRAVGRGLGSVFSQFHGYDS